MLCCHSAYLAVKQYQLVYQTKHPHSGLLLWLPKSVTTTSVSPYGLNTVVYKKKPSPNVLVVNRCLPLIEAKISPFFSSYFSPEVTADNVEQSLQDQLMLKKMVCTRLKTKFNT
jgi:hypothetical protein